MSMPPANVGSVVVKTEDAFLPFVQHRFPEGTVWRGPETDKAWTDGTFFWRLVAGEMQVWCGWWTPSSIADENQLRRRAAYRRHPTVLREIEPAELPGGGE